MMKIRFDDIPDPGLALTIQDAAWFPEGDWQRLGPLAGELFLSRRGKRVVVEGRLRFALRFTCDCCLEEFVDQFDSPFDLEFETLHADDPYWLSEDHQCPAADLDVVLLRSPEIDVDAALAQQVLLLLPVKRLCSDSCRGLCPTCGGNLNLATCACRDQQRQNPFQVLAKLKGK